MRHKRVRIAIQDSRHYVDRSWRRKRLAPGDHLVEHAAEAPDICARIDLHASGLFGRHVVRGAEHHADCGVDEILSRRHRIALERMPFAAEFRETEIKHFNDPIVTQHDVVRLDIAMDDTDRVRRRERACDLNADVERLVRPEWSFSNSITQRFAVDELRGDKVLGVDLVYFVDGENVWVVQR